MREKKKEKKKLSEASSSPLSGHLLLSPMTLSLLRLLSGRALESKNPSDTPKRKTLSRAKKKKNRRWFLKSFLLGKDKKKEEEEKFSIGPPTND